MIYRTRSELRLWDTWMLRVGDTYHLFTLTQPYALTYWDRVCHAVSQDLIHWEDWEDIVLEEKENKSAWDAGVILTGSAFECEHGYGMTYGACKPGEDIQRIGLLLSKDLHHWKKCAENPILVPRGPLYEDNPRDTTEPSGVAWRDAYVMRIDGGYEALICANDTAKARTVNGCIARVTSRDLIHWEYHSPIVSPGKYCNMEVPQYFELNGFHYLLFGAGDDLRARVATTGTYYLVGDSKYGEYRAPEDNLLIGSGDFRFDCFVGKVIPTDDGLMLYHHICGYRTAFAAPKTLVQDTDGRLSVERWKGLDRLLGERIMHAGSPGGVVPAHNDIPIGCWRPDGWNLIGEAGPAMSGWLFEAPLRDGAIRTTIDLRKGRRAGIMFRITDTPAVRGNPHGMALCLNRGRGVIQLCSAKVKGRCTVELRPLDTVYQKVRARTDVEIFLRGEYAEVYVDRRPLFVLNMDPGGPGYESMAYPMEGRTGCFAGEGTAVFRNYGVKAMPEPLR